MENEDGIKELQQKNSCLKELNTNLTYENNDLHSRIEKIQTDNKCLKEYTIVADAEIERLKGAFDILLERISTIISKNK